MTRTRVALAGLGSAARTIHLPALAKLEDVEVVGGFDPANKAPGVKLFASLEEMLTVGKPDIVAIATPPASHLAIATAALEAGCHVFCEKPLAATIAEANALAEIANRCGQLVAVNSEFPYMAIHSAARDEIGSDRFGRLLFADIRQSFVVTPDTEAGWRGDDQQRSFKEFGTHVLDLCKFFFGERPTAIRSRMPRPFSSGGPDYLDLVLLEFSGDRVAQITLDRLTRGRHSYLDIRLVGEKGTIETSIGGRAELTLGLRPKKRKLFGDLDFALGGRARLYHGDHHFTLAKSPLDLFPDATAKLYRAFIDAIREGRQPPNGLDESRHTLELLYDCYAKAQRLA
jgi:predicted dehydrogenase